MKQVVLFSIALIFVIFLSACGSGSDKSLQATNDALVGQLTAQAVSNVEATNEALKVELTQQAELIATQAAEALVPTNEPTIDYSLSEDTSSSYSLESWRLLWYPTATFLADDVVTTDEWDDFAAGMARNLAIPEPYYWEYLQVPDDTRYADIEKYYTDEATKEHDYKLAQTQQYVTKGGDDTYILTFTKGKGDSASRIVIQFWPKTRDFPAAVMVFYVNPD
jgi:hypothetical protein